MDKSPSLFPALFRGAASLLLLTLFCALVLPAILRGLPGGEGLPKDAIFYHIPQINAFLGDPLNLIDYRATATTLPFYHALVGWFARAMGVAQVGNGTVAVRLFHFLLCFGGIASILFYLERRAGRRVLLIALPLVTSWYVTSAAAFFGTDGPALTVMILSLLSAQAPRPRHAANAALMALAASVRHLTLPFTLGLFAAPLLWSARWRDWLRFIVDLLPTFLLLSFYIAHWKGLTPPGMVSRLNPPGLYPYAFLGHLSVLALWITAYAFCFRLPEWRALLARRQVQIWSAGLALLIAGLWLTQPTDFSRDHGRFGSIAWQLAPIATIGQHSLVVLALAILGAVGALLLYLDQRREGFAPVELLALLGFLASLSLTYAAYQRYSEPTILIALSMMFARVHNQPLVLWRAIPLLGLSAIGLGLSVTRLF